MKYSIPPPEDEKINVSSSDYGFLLLKLALFLVVAVLTLNIALRLTGSTLATALISPQQENKIFTPLVTKYFAQQNDAEIQEINNELQRIAERLSANLAHNNSIKFTVHYKPDSQIDAGATLGGHILINKGLLNELQTENEIATVLAHEISHSLNRDPLANVGGSLLSQIALLMILGNNPSAKLGLTSAQMEQQAYNRSIEERADAFAVKLIADTYGHVGGVIKTYEFLDKTEKSHRLDTTPSFLRSHPEIPKRIELIILEIKKHGWPDSGALIQKSPIFQNLPDTITAEPLQTKASKDASNNE